MGGSAPEAPSPTGSRGLAWRALPLTSATEQALVANDLLAPTMYRSPETKSASSELPTAENRLRGHAGCSWPERTHTSGARSGPAQTFSTAKRVYPRRSDPAVPTKTTGAPLGPAPPLRGTPPLAAPAEARRSRPPRQRAPTHACVSPACQLDATWQRLVSRGPLSSSQRSRLTGEITESPGVLGGLRWRLVP